ncbi:MAG TPA: 5-(carboxyamino)imidazole ribonucleotide mutase [Pyrinomonadaceae bacterium]|nr:5-(carboxyamino)imidazole ribonucleotide mutase [Pyrinomonadaceae bacterium]
MATRPSRQKGGRKAGRAQGNSSSSGRAVSPSSRRSQSPVQVAVVMGSKSDWETMRHADETLTRFGVPHECRVISAHRTPQLAAEFAEGAEARGVEVIIAAAGGAAHLAGILAAHTLIPVLGVPMKSESLNGLDSLLSTVQMPAGIPVGTLAIGKPGATNAALLAVAILSNKRPDLREKLHNFRRQQEQQVRDARLD